MDTNKITGERDVFYLRRNSDRTEGRGEIWLDTPCDNFYTAKRLGLKGGVQGADIEPIKGKAYLIDDVWYYRSRNNMPNQSDTQLQEDYDIKLYKEEQKQKILDKALELGLTEEEIAILGEG